MNMPRIMPKGAGLLAVLLGLTAAAAQQPNRKKEPAKKDDQTLKVVGELTAKDSFDRLRPGCHHKVHEFKLTAGITYIIDLIDHKPNSGMNPYLRLEDADGVQLAEDDDSGPVYQNAAILFAPEKTATYRIIVTTSEQGRTGKYLLEAKPLGTRPPPQQ